MIKVFRIPEGMTGAQMRAWIAPESIPLVTGPPFDPEAIKLLDRDDEPEYNVDNEGGADEKS